MNPITHARLREVLFYDPFTGIFRWRIKPRNIVPGNLPGGRDAHGYWLIRVDRKRYFAHRLAWFYVHGRWPIGEIDHRNGDPLDNRLENLREATRAQQLWNSGLRKNNRIGLKGVTFYPPTRRWFARIQKHGRTRFLGYHATAEAAHAAYVEAANSEFGEFARTE
jgi:hypothetical protein